MQLTEIEKFGVSEADNDDLLLECFEDHEAYISAKHHKNFLIVGRKGSGKTAIFRKLVSESSAEHFCYGHSFSDYPWFHHDKQRKTGVPDAECYRYSWEYVILISLAKLIVENRDLAFHPESFDALNQLEGFLEDTYGTKSPDLSNFFAPNTKLNVKKSLQINLFIARATVDSSSVPIEELPSIVYEVNDRLYDIIQRCVDKSHNYHICFDELDRGFNHGDSNYRDRLSGLLIAARDFNRKSRAANNKMSAVVFLRDDILRHLEFEDKNKIVEDFSSVIEWDKASTTKTLKGLMEKRFSRVLDIPQEGAWHAVFDEVQNMPGRQSKYQYILDRTFKRPRDIIKYCNEVLRVFKQNSERGTQFQNNDVAKARVEYSNYIRKELTDEMYQHFPHHNGAFIILRSIGQQSFTVGAFSKSYELIKLRKPELPPSNYILYSLFEFSAIGFLKVGGSGGGSEWVWKYQNTETEYDDRATVFRVHSGLKEVLELKQGRATVEGEEQLIPDLDDIAEPPEA